ncbi:MAG: LD-carboxypeptidase [Synechococcus sp. MED-G135]|nr:MAG: LD-carboxypeptidase [Synechococcus sp. MED-G135]
MSGLTAPLRKGDAVHVVAASSAFDDPEALYQGLEVLSRWGLKTDPTGIPRRRWGYLAGEDHERRNDLHPVPAAPLLACARGGWGAARLLEQPIHWRPGWLLGFSDVTALLLARFSAGLDGSIHGPLLSTLAAEPDWSQQRLKDLLFGQPLPDLQGISWASGTARGPLIAANLTVASHLLGSPHMPGLSGAILILEDVGESPYRIDRMLTHWRLTGALHKLSGLGFGRFSGCEDDEDSDGFACAEVLQERSLDLGIPVVADLPLGHGPGGNAALPIGREACLDGDRGHLRLL